MKTKELNIPVDEYASPISSFARPAMTLAEMVHIFASKGYRHLPVIENDKPIGIISQRDISLLKDFKSDKELTALDIMSENPYCVYKGTSLEDVAFHMSENKIGSAIIIDQVGNAESIFTSIDGLNALVEICRGDFE